MAPSHGLFFIRAPWGAVHAASFIFIRIIYTHETAGAYAVLSRQQMQSNCHQLAAFLLYRTCCWWQLQLALCLVGQHNCRADLQQAAPLGAYLGCFPQEHATSLPGVKETGVRSQVLHVYSRAGAGHSGITQCCCHRERGAHLALCISVRPPVGTATTPSPSSARSCAAGAQPPSPKHTSS